MLSPQGTTHIYEAPTNSLTPTIQISDYVFPSTPTFLVPGANGAQWANIYTTLYGNRNDIADAPKRATQSWQIFNPVQRIVFHQISKNFSFLLDLSGRQFPEYPHTAIATYNSSNSLAADISNKWGLEASGNFITADFKNSGYYFNAYDYIVPLYDNRAYDDFYYMSLRNYFPTEESQVTLRVSAPNKYTFGYVSPIDLSGEISTAQYISTSRDPISSRLWDPEYTQSLLAFNSSFIIGAAGKLFGGGVLPGFAGSNLSSVTGFGDFYGRIQAVFSTYSTLSVLASTINQQTTINVNNFVKTELKYIIPTAALSRQRATDPLRFSIQWKSALLPSYAALESGWGLGWNIGYAKADTPFATVQIAPSFYKIIDDYIQLRMNPEFDLNRMDTGSKENLATSLDSTGETKAYYGKLLLATFGSYAQTMISNPVAFLNPLGKLDRLTFQWLDTTGAVINNNDCEWNVVVQIVENLTTAGPKKAAPFDQTAYSG
jgi:hypothetical protein